MGLAFFFAAVTERSRFSSLYFLPLTRALSSGTLPARRFLVHLRKVTALHHSFAVRLLADLIENAARFCVMTRRFRLSPAKAERFRQQVICLGERDLEAQLLGVRQSTLQTLLRPRVFCR
jgi:hypothetical protein